MSATPAPAMSLSREELETDSELPRLGTGRTGGRGGGEREGEGKEGERRERGRRERQRKGEVR